MSLRILEFSGVDGHGPDDGACQRGAKGLNMACAF